MTNEECYIIHIEDSDADSDLLAIHLKRQNVPVRLIHLRDGQEAIQFLIENPSYENSYKAKSLIILDLGLPRVSGFEVLERLRTTKEANRRVIIFSGSDNPDDKIKCRELGADGYFVKPFRLLDYENFVKGPLMTHLSEVCPHLKSVQN